MGKWIPVLAIEDDEVVYITKPLDLMALGRIVKTKWEKYANRASVR